MFNGELMKSSGGGIAFNSISHQTRKNCCNVVCYEHNQWQSMFDVEQKKDILIHLSRCLMQE